MRIELSNEDKYRKAMYKAQAGVDRVLGPSDLDDLIFGFGGVIIHGIAAQAYIPLDVYVQDRLRPQAQYNENVAAGMSPLRAGVQTTFSCLADVVVTAGVKTLYVAHQISEAVSKK